MQTYNEAKGDPQFPHHTYKDHQLTRGKFFLTRLSIVRIPPLTTVYKKKDTLLGTFTHQMLYQGKETEGTFNKAI